MTEDQLVEFAKRAHGFAEYHNEKSKYGGAVFEFHARAQTFLESDVPALIAEVRSLRARVAAQDAELVKERDPQRWWQVRDERDAASAASAPRNSRSSRS